MMVDAQHTCTCMVCICKKYYNHLYNKILRVQGSTCWLLEGDVSSTCLTHQHQLAAAWGSPGYSMPELVASENAMHFYTFVAHEELL